MPLILKREEERNRRLIGRFQGPIVALRAKAEERVRRARREGCMQFVASEVMPTDAYQFGRLIMRVWSGLIHQLVSVLLTGFDVAPETVIVSVTPLCPHENWMS